MLDNVSSWVRDNKILTAVLFFLILLPVLLFSYAILGTQADSAQSYSGMAADTAVRAEGDGGSESFVEVKEGNIEINSDDADGDAERVEGLVENYNGYVEQNRKTDTSYHTEIDMTLRLPSQGENYSALIKSLRNEFRVASYEVQNYRLSTQQEQDEISILNTALSDYDAIRGDIRQMQTSPEKMDLLMEVTEKQLEIQDKKKRYERDLSEKQRRSDEATLHVTIKEDKAVEILPDNIGNRFRESLQDTIDALVGMAVGLVTDGVTLFFRVVQIILYFIIAIIPVAVAYRLGMTLYRQYW